ncbi:hypothetical protein BH10PLA1_BH10PLA1_14530 [soil metagenome]
MTRFFVVLLVSVSSIAGRARAEAPVTYTKDIAPIVYNNCIGCHRPGEVAPFSLMTYDDAKKRADQLAEVTKSRFMPPWKAETGYGEFVGARHLTDEQIATFGKWLAQGAPQGEAKDLPVMPKFVDGWQLGEPDLIVKVDRPYTVKADGRDEFRCFVVPLKLGEDKYVSAVEFRPDNRKVVHHALMFLDTKGRARKLDAADPQPGYERAGGPGFTPTGGLGGWAPGAFVTPLPDGVARLVPKGADLVIQTHFHPSGKTEQEQSSVGIYFAKKPPEKPLAGLVLRSRNIDIPPGKADYTLTDSIQLPVDIDVIGVTPHAHLICKEMHAWATLPDGKITELIWIKDWDFNWQEKYQYKTAVKLPKGSTIQMKYVYDNSADNPHNPNTPPKRVTFGEQTSNEMAYLFMQVTTAKPSDRLALVGAMMRHKAGKEDD